LRESTRLARSIWWRLSEAALSRVLVIDDEPKIVSVKRAERPQRFRRDVACGRLDPQRAHEQTDLRPLCRAFIAAAFDALDTP
jgi:hypothetical protein